MSAHQVHVATAGTIDTDVCIVGSGPAGLSVALGLLGSGLDVVIVEVGTAKAAGPSSARLGPVTVVGDDPYPGSDLQETRATGLGGTATIWSYRMDPGGPDSDAGTGCRYAPLDPVDVEARPDVPHDGWPFGRAELDPWYARAQEVAELGRFDYSTEGWATPDAQPLDPAPGRITSSMFQFGPATAFTVRALERLRAHPDVRIVAGAAVTAVLTDRTGSRATGVRFAVDGGGTGVVRSRATVLAAGGIENSRLLLLSGGAGSPGLGNTYDQVGRYWMEHPLVRGGMLVVAPGSDIASRMRLYDAHRRDGTLVMAKLTLTEQLVRTEGLLSSSVLFLPRDGVVADPGVLAYRRLRGALRGDARVVVPGAGAGPDTRLAAARGLASLAVTAGVRAPRLLAARRSFATQAGVDDWGWSRRPDAADVPVLEVVHQTEQAPHPDNRVMLGDDIDVFGRRTAALHWRWRPEDRERITRSRNLYANAFAARGWGRFVGGDWDRGAPELINGNHHHLGGTRMHRDPRRGVVDPDCAVHGVPNLFVAGSSVFPSGGSANPTLTIVALSLRLAEHLRPRVPQLPGPQELDRTGA